MFELIEQYLCSDDIYSRNIVDILLFYLDLYDLFELEDIALLEVFPLTFFLIKFVIWYK